MAEKKIEWRIMRIGKCYLFVPKTETYPKYLKLKACDLCGHAHYEKIKMYKVGVWIGEFTDRFGSWLQRMVIRK